MSAFPGRPSAAERVAGALAVLGESGRHATVLGVENRAERDDRFRMLTRDGFGEGVLLISLTPTDREVARFAASGTPVVLVDADHPGLPRVRTDDLHGGHLAGRHLLELGHRRIGFVGDVVESGCGFASSLTRRIGLQRALREARLPLAREHTQVGPHDREAAAGLAHRLLARVGAPTAIFAASDTQALGVLDAAAALGRAVPDELSVIGFDDIEGAEPAGLTTVRQPLRESGERGAALLLAALTDPEPPAPKARLLRLELIPRATTAPPPPGG